MRVNNLSLDTIKKNNLVFVYGNDLRFRSAFSETLRIVHCEYNFHAITANDIKKGFIPSVEIDLFESKKNFYIISGIADKHQQDIENFLKICIDTGDGVLLEVGDYKDSKKISPYMISHNNVIAVPFFSEGKESLSLISILAELNGIKNLSQKDLLLFSEAISSSDDSISDMIKKISLSDLDSVLSELSPSKHRLHNLTGIETIRFLLAFIKSGKRSESLLEKLLKDFHKKIEINPDQLLEHCLKYEIKFKQDSQLPKENFFQDILMNRKI